MIVAQLPGLRQLAIEKRITEAPPIDSRRYVDLLDLVDPATDAINGNWHLEGGALVCQRTADSDRIELPYVPPEEYDFRM